MYTNLETFGQIDKDSAEKRLEDFEHPIVF